MKDACPNVVRLSSAVLLYMNRGVGYVGEGEENLLDGL
jgi:hypothetical protein